MQFTKCSIHYMHSMAEYAAVFLSAFSFPYICHDVKSLESCYTFRDMAAAATAG